MKLRQPLVFVLAALSLLFFFAGCNDTFRPVVNPVPQPGGVPAQLKVVLVLSSTGTTGVSPGVLSILDVSGDTNIGEIVVGHNATSIALGAGNNIVYVANQADSSISTINGIVPSTVSPLTLTQSVSDLPAGLLCPTPPCAPLNPMVVAGNNLYIAQAAPSVAPTPPAQGVVFVTSAVTGLTLTGTIPIGVPSSTPRPQVSIPTQLLGAAAAGKAYSLNTNTNDLTSWSVQTNAVQKASISVGAGPISAVVNAQQNRLFTLNATDGTVSVVDTTNDEVINAGTDAAPTVAMPVGSKPTAMFLDNNNNRLFVANNVSNSISIINVAVPQPTASPTPNPLVNPNPNFGQTTTISMPTQCVLPGTSGTFTIEATNVVATPDGNRAYVLSEDNLGHACVFLVSLLDNRVVPAPVLVAFVSPTGPMVYDFAISSDGTKVYVVAHAPGAVPTAQTPVIFTNSQGQQYSANAASLSTNSTITTVNSTITSTNNTVALINVPQQPVPPLQPNATPTPTPLPATPVQVIAQP